MKLDGKFIEFNGDGDQRLCFRVVFDASGQFLERLCQKCAN